MPKNMDHREDLCNRWKADVFAFCFAFLGDRTAAEETACDALLAYCREQGPSRHDQATQARLMRLALLAAQEASSQGPECGSRLEAAIQRLPRSERAVVVMRNLLRMEWEYVALATGLSTTQAQKIWRLGILQLTAVLQTEFVERNR